LHINKQHYLYKTKHHKILFFYKKNNIVHFFSDLIFYIQLFKILVFHTLIHLAINLSHDSLLQLYCNIFILSCYISTVTPIINIFTPPLNKKYSRSRHNSTYIYILKSIIQQVYSFFFFLDRNSRIVFP